MHSFQELSTMANGVQCIPPLDRRSGIGPCNHSAVPDTGTRRLSFPNKWAPTGTLCTVIVSEWTFHRSTFAVCKISRITAVSHGSDSVFYTTITDDIHYQSDKLLE